MVFCLCLHLWVVDFGCFGVLCCAWKRCVGLCVCLWLVLICGFGFDLFAIRSACWFDFYGLCGVWFD